MAYIQPLDLKELLVTHFAGSIYVFIIIAFLAVLILGARWRMSLATLMFSVVILTFVFYGNSLFIGNILPMILLIVIAVAIIVVPILYRKWS